MSVGVGQGSTIRRLIEAVGRWAATAEVGSSALPSPSHLRKQFSDLPDPCRPPVSAAVIEDWEHRHGFRLPRGLRAWLAISDGFYLGVPVIHPIAAIGPMVPFARMAGLMVQPESWFEIGNPTETETVCIDLGYRWPGGGDHPLFMSGDDERRSSPRIIAVSFEEWFIRLLHEGGRPFWLDPLFPTLGDPWDHHRRMTPVPALPAALTHLIDRALPLVRAGIDERMIAYRLNVSCIEAETLVRHIQHIETHNAPDQAD